MQRRDMVVIGASAGGVQVLQALVAALPKKIDAAVFIVLHIPVHTPTSLHSVLNAAGPNDVKLAEDGERIAHGTIYVAPTDRHVVIEEGRIRLTRGPRENRVRPCIDVLFRSCALAYGPRVIGVVLSGALDDGTAGLWAIKERGGIALAQDPNESEWPSMPQSAIDHVAVDDVLPVRALAERIVSLIQEPLAANESSAPPERMKFETQVAIEGNALKRGVLAMGEVSGNTCPECHGVLVKIREGKVTRFRCHTGHAFSLQTLLVDVDNAIDQTLWNAVRAIEERAIVLRDMEKVARSENDHDIAERCAAEAQDAEERAQRVRDLVVKDPASSTIPQRGQR
jgi:two-component system, chemotaxis family, protein-glutamate methylesterase/glutaminase